MPLLSHASLAILSRRSRPLLSLSLSLSLSRSRSPPSPPTSPSRLGECYGAVFKVGSGLSDADREDPPAVGSTITFAYTELTNAGVPRFPRFKHVFHGR